MYGSSGEIMTELAIGLAGGKENTDQTPSFVKAVAKVDLRVVIAATISPPCFEVKGMEQLSL